MSRIKPDAASDPNEWIQLAIDRLDDVSLDGFLTGEALESYLQSQAYLITSLPLLAAQKAQELAMQAVITGNGDGLIEQIQALGDITVRRAELVARTSVSSVASGLVQIRSEKEGSEGYIWRTCRDSLVRPAHRILEGKFIPWRKPPQAGGGMVYHAGQGPNCRCYPEPVFSRFRRGA